MSIGDLSERTGVPPATLRTWEARYGRPCPQRLPGGHRRYGDDDVVLVQEVLRRRASGLSMEAAVAGSVVAAGVVEHSVFAGLRRRYPQLQPQLLSKPTLLALSRAIEDECCARAERPALFVSFQRERFYERSRSRWQELARTATAVVVFADFAATEAAGSVLTVALPADAPLRREWVLVCDAPDFPACVAGWEPPRPPPVPDGERRFETVWTVDPGAVRKAARVCARLAQDLAPGLAGLVPMPADGAPAASPDLARAEGLLNRMVGYLEATTRR